MIYMPIYAAEQVHIENLAGKGNWPCANVASGTFAAVTPTRDTTNSNCNYTATSPR
jgi:hypothetical protein